MYLNGFSPYFNSTGTESSHFKVVWFMTSWASLLCNYEHQRRDVACSHSLFKLAEHSRCLSTHMPSACGQRMDRGGTASLKIL